jgi:hypothetical protein
MVRRQLSLDDMDPMEIDTTTGQLFWHGKQVVTSMSLPAWVHLSALVTAISTAVLAVATIIPILKDLVKYLSQ